MKKVALYQTNDEVLLGFKHSPNIGQAQRRFYLDRPLQFTNIYVYDVVFVITLNDAEGVSRARREQGVAASGFVLDAPQKYVAADELDRVDLVTGLFNALYRPL